jgi:hypothetical protein
VDHPVVKKNPKLLAQTQQVLLEALKFEQGPIRELRELIYRSSEFIKKSKNIIDNNPALRALHRVSEVTQVVGGVVAGVDGYARSPADETGLKLLNGLLAGAGNFALMVVGGLPAAIDDFALGGNARGAVTNAADSVIAFAKLLFTGDPRTAESLVDKMEAGGNGPLVQAAARASAAVDALLDGSPEAIRRFAEESRKSRNPIISGAASAGENAYKLIDSLKKLFSR